MKVIQKLQIEFILFSKLLKDYTLFFWLLTSFLPDQLFLFKTLLCNESFGKIFQDKFQNFEVKEKKSHTLYGPHLPIEEVLLVVKGGISDAEGYLLLQLHLDQGAQAADHRLYLFRRLLDGICVLLSCRLHSHGGESVHGLLDGRDGFFPQSLLKEIKY